MGPAGDPGWPYWFYGPEIEALEARDETVGLMAAAGFKLTDDFGPNLFFGKD